LERWGVEIQAEVEQTGPGGDGVAVGEICNTFATSLRRLGSRVVAIDGGGEVGGSPPGIFAVPPVMQVRFWLALAGWRVLVIAPRGGV